MRVGRYGPFLEQAERRASIPDSLPPPDELTIDKALEMLGKQAAGDEPLGIDPESKKNVYVKQGRFGPYVQLAPTMMREKKLSSLLKGMAAEDVTMEIRLQLLSLPKHLASILKPKKTSSR